jgi:hypothetical protein
MPVRPAIRRCATILAFGLGVLAVAGCSRGNEMTDLPKPPADFCRAGKTYEERITSGRRVPIDDQVRLVRRMDAAAPPDVAEDTATFLDALVRVQAGDEAAVDSPEVRDAVTRVNRRYSQGCGVYDRRGGI